jgi:hypothetical protein
MRKLMLIAVLLAACNEIAPTLGSNQGADGGTTDTDAGPAAPCLGFKDVNGQCYDHSCLGTAECDPQTAVLACGDGIRGSQGTCFGGLCAYVNGAQGCSSSDQCPCGLCGVDGRCYEDRQGACGVCVPGGTGSSGKSGTTTLPCKTCLQGCQGASLCCSGPGCLCEPQCEGFQLARRATARSGRTAPGAEREPGAGSGPGA